jgi:hypothetical protein
LGDVATQRSRAVFGGTRHAVARRPICHAARHRRMELSLMSVRLGGPPRLVGTANALILALALAASVAASTDRRLPPAELASDAGAPTSDLWIALGQLLGEHAFLVMQGMRVASEGGARFDALVSALADNSGNLGDAIGNAIADQFPERFGDVKSMPATSTSASPLSVPGSWALIAAAVLSLLLIGRRVMRPRR